MSYIWCGHLVEGVNSIHYDYSLLHQKERKIKQKPPISSFFSFFEHLIIKIDDVEISSGWCLFSTNNLFGTKKGKSNKKSKMLVRFRKPAEVRFLGIFDHPPLSDCAIFKRFLVSTRNVHFNLIFSITHVTC